MAENKTVEPGHRVVTNGNSETRAEGESSTALDELLEDSPYQLGMAPLASEQPDGGDTGAQGNGGNAPAPDTPNTATKAQDAQLGAERSYGDMTPAELRALCKERGLKSAANIKREVLISSLLEYDEQQAAATANTEADDGVVVVILKKGATYRVRGKVFTKNKPMPVEMELAEKLVRTGMFVKG